MARGIVAVFAVLCSIIALSTLVQLFRFRVTAAGALFELVFAAAAVAGWWFVFANHQLDTGPRVRSAAKWGLIVGAIGFLGGFVGPIIFAPQSNQGPMLGIFITGPIGFAAGAIYGVVCAARGSARP